MIVNKLARRAVLGALLVAAILVLILPGCSNTAPINEAALPPVVHVNDEKDHAFPSSAPDSMRRLTYPLDGGDTGNGDKGSALFQENCVRCHGAEGLGDGPDARTMNPKPANLATGHVSMMSDGLVFYLITTGIRGTAMPSWKELSADDRWRIIRHLRNINPPTPPSGGGHDGHNM